MTQPLDTVTPLQALGAGGGSGATALADLSDVTLSSPSNGEVLGYDSTGTWVNTTISGGGATALGDLSDVSFTTALAAGDMILYTSSGTWEATPFVVGTAGSGDVTGPASSTDNAVARFNGTTGKIIQNSALVVTDDGQVKATGNNAKYYWNESDAGSNEKVWDLLALSGVMTLRLLNDAESATSTVLTIDRSAHTYIGQISWFTSDGMTIGSPTGGAKGTGTLNAQAVYDDNTLLTDYVFDAHLDGVVNTTFYNNSVPDRVIAPRDGNPQQIEPRTHVPAQRFQNNLNDLDVQQFITKWETTRKLPAFERFTVSQPSIGEIGQALLETCEVQAVHIKELHARIAALEAIVNP